MSDYLSRAADRATGTNTTIRPVLPSLFDAERSSSEAASMMSESRVEHSTAQRSVDAAPPIGQPVSDIGKRVASVLTLAPEHSGEVSTEEKQTGLNVSPASAKSPRQDVPTEEEGQTPGIPSPRKEPATSSLTGDVESKAGRSDDERAAKLRQPVRPRAIERTNDKSQPAQRVIAFPRRRVAILNQTPSKNSFSDDRSSPTEPSIQVTIGRLEVRAVQQAPASSKPAPKSSRMSLEEYLRSENGKSR